MMRLAFTVDIGGMRRKLTTLVEHARDLDVPLRKFGATWLRHRMQVRFEQEGPGWAPRAASTTAKLLGAGAMVSARADRFMARKLAGDTRRARRRLDRLATVQGFDREARRQRERAAKGKRGLSMVEVVKRARHAVERRERTERLFALVTSGGAPTPADAKAVAKLGERTGRARRTASGPLLGRIASSFKLNVSGGRLSYGSTIPWAAAHNAGASVGRGANVPAREFAILDDRDLDILVDMIVGWLGQAVEVE